MSKGEDICWLKVKVRSLLMDTGIGILTFWSINHSVAYIKANIL